MARFSDVLLEHARHPHNVGRNAEANATGRADWAGQPPSVELFLHIENGVVLDATFCAAGCGVTVAVGSVLTELLKGRAVQACMHLQAEHLSNKLEGIPPDKRFCANVAIAALRDALGRRP